MKRIHRAPRSSSVAAILFTFALAVDAQGRSSFAPMSPPPSPRNASLNPRPAAAARLGTPPTTWYVDDDATPPFLGTAQQPFAQISDAIASAQVIDHDLISVAPGNYSGFEFAGKAVTVRSQLGPTATWVGPVAFVDGESAASVLQGFRVQGGGGTLISFQNGPTWAGGCIVSFGSPTVVDCVLTGGLVEPQQSSGGNAYGGAVYTTGAMTLIGCTISNNEARGVDQGYAAGGGVYGPARLVDCTIECNAVWGDPMSSWTGDPVCGGGAAFATLENCTIRGNMVDGPNTTGAPMFRGHAEGGGLYSGSASGCRFENNVVFAQSRDDFVDTDRGFGGGAARSMLSDCIVRNNKIQLNAVGVHGPAIGGAGVFSGSAVRCEIYGNDVAPSHGGGMSGGGGASGTLLRKCVIRDNTADWGGGVRQAAGVIRQCTIFRNEARLAGGGVSACAQLDSCILRANQPDAVHVTVQTQLSYCSVDELVWAIGSNSSADPRLWNPNVPDLHLRPGSPCIDSGSPQLPPDVDGSRADVGALVFSAAYCGEPLVYCTAKTNSLGCVPQIAAFGGPYGGDWAPSLWVTCRHVLNQRAGVLFFGLNGRANTPFLGGTLCVAAPALRTPVQWSGGSSSGADCSGVFAFDFGALISGGQNPGLAAGAQVNSQYWSRDPSASATAGLSDAVEFVVCH